MIFTIKNKDIFNLRKKLKHSKNKDGIAGMTNSLVDFKIRQWISCDKVLFSKIQKLIKVLLSFKGETDDLSILCINLIYYKIQELNKCFRVIECKAINKAFVNRVNLDDIYGLSDNFKTKCNNDIYTYKVIKKDKIDESNLEQSLRNDIPINIACLCYNTEDRVEGKKFVLIDAKEYNKNTDVLVKIRFNSNNPVYLENIINAAKDKFFGVKYHFENKIIDILPDDYEIYNLEEIKSMLREEEE